MNEVYLEFYSLTDVCLAPIETIITLFTIKYCNSNIGIKLVKSSRKQNEKAYTFDISTYEYNIITQDEVPYIASICELPNIILGERSCFAGLCAILRQIIKETLKQNPSHECRQLLGFKESCLLACSEASVWTKFCEVDMILTVKMLDQEETIKHALPVSIARFERHMTQPVRLHNIKKYTTSKKFIGNYNLTEDGNNLLDHTYAEGPVMTLADLMIFVCIHIILNKTGIKNVEKLIPLTMRWYKKMLNNQMTLKCVECILSQYENETEYEYTLPEVPNQSLYKSDSKRYKPKNCIYTRQEEVDRSLQLAAEMGILTARDNKPFGSEISLDWNSIPYEATPDGGKLPSDRLKRKYEQLENMCKPVIKLVKKGDTIVDFCSGGGHLGILIAYLLRDCSVILLENKEQSLNRAVERVKNLKLTNVLFCQSNLDYFRGKFNIGTSLHACGVATDLVIQQCLKNQAIFVSCPCCYGSLQNCHHLSYPKSDDFKNRMNVREYMILSHAADQTHDEQNVKTKQGYLCMTIVDIDRKLHAEQYGYTVHLGKFVPKTCTPKNHILIGIPNMNSQSINI